MATTRKPFGNRTSAEGIAANRKAAVPPPPPPAPVARPKSGTKPSPRVTPPNSTATPPKAKPGRPTETLYSQGAVDKAIKENKMEVGKQNAQTFMQIINGMPPETKNRYLSAFTDFLALPPEQQSTYLAGLDQLSKDIVKPKIDQDRRRTVEDFEYEREKKEAEKRSLQSTFDKIKGNMDFNKNRDIAKENESAARVMQNVGNVAFVTGIAGSGIFSRRTAYVRENLQNKVDDVNIDFNQKIGELSLSKGIKDQQIDSEIDRLYNLNERDLTDLDQKQKEDELSLFFELAGNRFGEKGEQNAQILESGNGSALDDFIKGGTDQERQGRYGAEQAEKAKQARRAELGAAREKQNKDAGEYRQLFDLSSALSSLGRTAEAQNLRKYMESLKPSLNSILSEASSGYVNDPELEKLGIGPRNFFGATGSGIGNLGDWENRWSKQFLEKNSLLYKGMNSEARAKLTKLIDDNVDTIRKYQS